MNPSPIRYTWSGDFGIGYQTIGEGPVDLLYVPPWTSNLDGNWLWDHHARFLRRLASFSRLILFDPRGWGVSDRYPPGAAPTLEEHTADMMAVLDALNISAAAVMGSAESGVQALHAAASAPGRVSALVLFHCSPVWVATADLPWASPEERVQSVIESVRRSTSWDEWARQFVREALPTHADDEQAIAWF